MQRVESEPVTSRDTLRQRFAMMMWMGIACVACSAPPHNRPAPTPVRASEPARSASEDSTCAVHDPKDPACKTDCRHADCKCPSPPDVELAACWPVMACPHPPDGRVRACRLADAPGAHQPVLARVLKVELVSGETIITVGAGADHGVARDWQAVVLRDGSDDPLAPLTIMRVDHGVTVAKVHLTSAQLISNNHVRLTRPA